MKTILVITDNLPDQINGVVTTYKNIEKLAVLDGYRFLYLDPRQFLHVGCPGYPEVRLGLPWRIGKKIQAMDPDHIHIATEGPIGLGARLYLDQCGFRYNTSYHTRFPEFLNKIYRVPESWTYAYLRWFHKHSGRVLTNTRTMIATLQKQGFDTDIVEWTRGVDRELLRPTVTHPGRSDPPRVLYVGRVSKEKGLDDLCELQDRYQVNIVGDGPYRAALEKKYPSVTFHGYLLGEDLANQYAQADVFVFPSRTDTFGIVIIEAMSMGVPVAGYAVTGPRDIIEIGITGHYGDDLVDCIDRCLELDRDKIKEISGRWTWQECWQVFRNNLLDVM